MKRRLLIIAILGTSASILVAITAAPWKILPSVDEVERELSLIGTKYSIDIEVADRDFSTTVASTPIRGRAPTDLDMRRYGVIFVSEWNRYPRGFVTMVNLPRIILCRDLSVAGQPRAAVPDFGDCTLYLDVALGRHSGRYQRYVIHHDFFHMLDYSDDGIIRRDEEWEALNPEGFRYGPGGWIYHDDRQAGAGRDDVPGFLNRYSTSGVEEDKAEVFANMMVDYKAVLVQSEQDPVLAQKVGMMKERVRHLCGDMDDAFWELLPARRPWAVKLFPYAAILWLAWLIGSVVWATSAFTARVTVRHRASNAETKLDVRVDSTDPRIGLWLVAVIALTLPLGFTGPLVVLFAAPLVVSGVGIGGPQFFIVATATVMSAGYVLLLWRLIRSRKKFWSKPRKAQKISVVLYILAGSAPVTLPLAIWLVGALF